MITPFRRTGRLRMGRTLLLVAAISGLASYANRDAPHVRSARPVFGPFVLNQCWMPVRSRVVNPTSEPLNASLVIAFPLNGSLHEDIRFVRPVHLPPHTSREVETGILFDVDPHALLANHEFRNRGEEATFPDGTVIQRSRLGAPPFTLDVSLADADSGVALDSVPMLTIPTHPESVFDVVVAGELPRYEVARDYKMDGLSFALGEHEDDVTAFHGQELLDTGPFTRRVLAGRDRFPSGSLTPAARVSDLPARWATFEGVDALVFGNLRDNRGPGSLNAQQRHALVRWIRSGGTVIVAPTSDPEGFRSPFWSGLLPVRLRGMRSLGAAQAGVLEQRYGGEYQRDLELPPLMVEAEARPEGEVVLESDGMVLLARRRVGGGTVWFSAVSGNSMQSWSGATRLWGELLSPPLDPVPGLAHEFLANSADTLARVTGAATPQRATVVSLMLLYLILGIAALAVSRRARRAEFGWLALLVLAAVMTGLAYMVGRAARTKIGLVQSEIGVTVLRPGESQGSATSVVGLFSPKQRSTTLRWTNPDTLACPQPLSTSGAGLRQRAATVVQTGNFVFPEFSINPAELLVSRAMTLVQYGEGVELQVRYGPNGPEGRVVNRTGQPLRNCLLRLNRRSMPLGDLAPGDSVDLAGRSLSWGLQGGGVQLAGTEEDRVRRSILASLLRIPRFGRSGGAFEARWFAWPIALYGWTDPIQADLELLGEKGSTPRKRAYQLLSIPTSPTAGADDIVLPPGCCDVAILNPIGTRLFGAARLPPKKSVRLPMGKRIAGMKRRPEKPRSTGPARSVYGKPTEPDPLAPPGWNEGAAHTTGRIGFRRPRGLEDLAVTEVILHTDIHLIGFVADIAVRRFGSKDKFVELGTLTDAESVLQKALPSLSQFMTPQGDLPEFQLKIHPPKGEQPSPNHRWNVRQFDIEVRGQLPAPPRELTPRSANATDPSPPA